MSSKLVKPSQQESKELGRLFSHCAPSTSKRANFDPNQHFLAPDKKRKKRASTSEGRCVNVNVCRLPKFTPFIPKGKFRSNLRQKGRIQTVQLTRSMNSERVRECITRSFSLPSAWDYLSIGQDNRLAHTELQSPDGSSICSHRSFLYIVDKDVSGSVCIAP